MIEERFTEPDDFKWGAFKNKRNQTIRYGHVKPTTEIKATMIIAQGNAETIEKYFETIRDMLDRGYEVWAMDWMGQGGSDRYLDNRLKNHSESFDEHLEDFHQFITEEVKPSKDLPLILNAHSMGGHLSLRYLREYPKIFDLAVTCSTMLGFKAGPIPKKALRTALKFAKAAGMLKAYIPADYDWDRLIPKFKMNFLTHDEKRYMASFHHYAHKEELRLGGHTYGWGYHANISEIKLNDEKYLKSINTPVLMGIPHSDKVVNIDAQKRAASLLPDCERFDLPDARHELWMEKDSLRQAWLNKVDSFIGKHLKNWSPSVKTHKSNHPINNKPHL